MTVPLSVVSSIGINHFGWLVCFSCLDGYFFKKDRTFSVSFIQPPLNLVETVEDIRFVTVINRFTQKWLKRETIDPNK